MRTDMHHVNSEGERISIELCTAPQFADQWLLAIHDDPPPMGSGIKAPMLLDVGTQEWLLHHLRALKASREEAEA